MGRVKLFIQTNGIENGQKVAVLLRIIGGKTLSDNLQYVPDSGLRAKNQ
jgi:hypothetical protein